ncbi:hypothetical protein HanRHA438_Chr07g0289471 [Helianthus annuus]|nr:hypothetical protein HanRHA438_Chr07g0289471 [Helianthus annuus]
MQERNLRMFQGLSGRFEFGTGWELVWAHMNIFKMIKWIGLFGEQGSGLSDG